MRIVQLIDSLEAGGAERMAVNYANALAARVDFSALVTTRKEGSLKNQLDKKVDYLFLNKKATVDWRAVFKLRKYIVKNKIQIIQAHSSSFFLAVLVKLSLPNIKIIWHDHYGNSDFLENRSRVFLECVKFFFSGIISVNEKLQAWSLDKLHFKNVIYLSNFVLIEQEVNQQTILEGQSGKRIVCLANLRPQKNHFLLLDIALKVKESHPDWSFHLVGKDFHDSYSQQLKEYLVKQQLASCVFIYSSCQDITGILKQTQIGILTSDSEGLPVTVLEYGLHKKAVVLTEVGQIAAVVNDGENGFLVQSNNSVVFYNRLVELMEDKLLQERFADKLHQTVVRHFSATPILKEYIRWIKTTIVNE